MIGLLINYIMAFKLYIQWTTYVANPQVSFLKRKHAAIQGYYMSSDPQAESDFYA